MLGLGERRVQVVRGLLEDIGHDLLLIGTHKPDLYAPCSHGIAFHLRRFIAAQRQVSD